MPKLKVCGRAWAIGTDDFVAPSALSIYFRLLVLSMVLTIVILIQNKLLKCDQPYFYVTLYLFGTLAFTSIVLIIDFTVFCMSRRGGIMDERPRRHIPKFFIMRCVLTVLEVGWTFFGTVVVAYDFPCESTTHVLLIVWMLIAWLLQSFFLMGMFIIFDPLGSTHCDCDEYPVHASKIWKVRMYLMRMLMCRYKFYEEFEDVAKLFQDEFRHNELVLSDLTAGVILLSRKQQAESQRFFDEAYKFALEEQLTHEEARKVMYFYKFASAAYGWPNYVVEDRSHVAEIFCPLSCGDDEGYTNLISREGECACHYNSRVVINRASIKREDLVAISFTNTIREVPFYVCADHESSNIIVAIRGTQSLSDAITDMIIHPAPIQWGYPDSFLAHKGMLAAANYVFAKLIRIKVFDFCFEKWPDYNLIITGHSLGAGVACLVTFILRKQEFLKDKSIIGYTYAPPGILLSVEASDYSTQFIYTGVLERDVVPRMSLGAIRRIERELNEALCESSENKSTILCGSVAGCVGKALPCCPCFKSKEPEKKLFCADDVACRDHHKCRTVTGNVDVEGNQLLPETCYCREDLVDNSRADSHVIPHEKHDHYYADYDVSTRSGRLFSEEKSHVSKMRQALDRSSNYLPSSSGTISIKSTSSSSSSSTTTKESAQPKKKSVKSSKARKSTKTFDRKKSIKTSKSKKTIHELEQAIGNAAENQEIKYVPKRVIDERQIGRTVPLYPPGVCLYFEPCHPTEEGVVDEVNGRRLTKIPHFINYVKTWKEYRYFWIKRSFFDRIFITERMFSSHFPFTMDYAIVLGQPRVDVFDVSPQNSFQVLRYPKIAYVEPGRQSLGRNLDDEETRGRDFDHVNEDDNDLFNVQVEQHPARTGDPTMLSDITERGESNVGTDYSKKPENTEGGRMASLPIRYESSSVGGESPSASARSSKVAKRRSRQIPNDESMTIGTVSLPVSPAKKNLSVSPQGAENNQVKSSSLEVEEASPSKRRSVRVRRKRKKVSDGAKDTPDSGRDVEKPSRSKASTASVSKPSAFFTEKAVSK